MGCEFNSESFNAKSINEAVIKAGRIIENSRSDHGCSYSGRLGMKDSVTFKGHFKTIDEAIDFIMENNYKWSDYAYLVSCGAKAPKNDKESSVLVETEEEIRKFGANVATRIREQKSEYKSCSDCGSKIRTKFISTSNCPVCNKSFMTETDVKRLNTLKAKAQKAKEVLASKEDYLFLVGGNCAS
jgi:Zn-finger domain-containing protein